MIEGCIIILKLVYGGDMVLDGEKIEAVLDRHTIGYGTVYTKYHKYRISNSREVMDKWLDCVDSDLDKRSEITHND